MRGSPPITFEVARTPDRTRSVHQFQRLCYSEMGREDLAPQNIDEPADARALDARLNLIEARVGSETVGTIRWGVYSQVAGIDRYADSIFQQQAGLPSGDPSIYSRTDRLLIHPRHRRGTVLIGLARTCLQLAIRAGAQYDLCWSEKSLSRIYRRLGYQTLPQLLINPRGLPLLPQVLRISHFKDRWAGRADIDRACATTSDYHAHQEMIPT